MKRQKIIIGLLVWGLCQFSYASNKPEVIINPGGLDAEELKLVNDGVSSVVRQADDQDGGEADRIRRKAREAVISSLQTRGYFKPKVTLEVGEDIGGDTWEITIDPGEQSKVSSVKNDFTGHITQPEYADRIQKLREQWGLPKGKVFINSDWSDAKSDLLDAVAKDDFFFARINSTHALVNPETSTVDVDTSIDSGPAVTLGHIEVLGLRRVPMSLISKYIDYKEGERFSQDKLDQWQQALQSTNFFRGAFVTIKKPEQGSVYDLETAQLPVQVRVTEGSARTLKGSIGVDDSYGVRVEGIYRQNVVFDKAVTLETGASLSFKEQRAYMDFYLPPNDDGTVDSFGLLAKHSDIENEEVTRFGIGWKRSHEFKFDPMSRVEYESNWAVLGAYDSVKHDGEDRYRLPTVVGTWELLRRDVNNKFDPRDGNLLVLGLGVGTDLQYHTLFSRAGLRGQIWWPVGRRDNFSLRAEVGQVFAGDDTRFPDDFGYRTGGARTVRGYKYMGLGKSVGDSVIGTRSLAVASAEYTHYFDDMFGMAYFVDVGDAAPSFKEMDPAFGYGVGARVKTPAGPFFLDLAWGQRDRKLRLHFSLGIAF